MATWPIVLSEASLPTPHRSKQCRERPARLFPFAGDPGRSLPGATVSSDGRFVFQRPDAGKEYADQDIDLLQGRPYRLAITGNSCFGQKL